MDDDFLKVKNFKIDPKKIMKLSKLKLCLFLKLIQMFFFFASLLFKYFGNLIILKGNQAYKQTSHRKA